MPERLTGENGILIEEVDEQNFDSLITLIDEALVFDRVKDPVETQLLSSLLHEITEFGYGPADRPIGERTRGPLAQVFKEVFTLRRTMGQNADPGYVSRLAEFSLDMLLRDTFPEYYPAHAFVPEFWRDLEPLKRIDYESLRVEMLGELISSMADAYAIYQIITAAIERNNPGYSPVVLDNGVGRAMGAKKWLGPGFSPPRVYAEPGPGDAIAPDSLSPDFKMQALVNELIARGPVVDKIIGYDQVPNDPEHKGYYTATKRSFSHTFPMSESLRRPEEVKEFVYLDALRLPKLILPRTRIRAGQPGAVEEIRSFLPDGQADIGIYSAVLFEQTPEGLKAIREQQKELYREGGIVLETDFFARPSRTHPAGERITRRDWWNRLGSFAIVGRDPHDPEKPAKEIARFLTRRGTEMWFTKDGQRLIETGSLY